MAGKGTLATSGMVPETFIGQDVECIKEGRHGAAIGSHWTVTGVSTSLGRLFWCGCVNGAGEWRSIPSTALAPVGARRDWTRELSLALLTVFSVGLVWEVCY